MKCAVKNPILKNCYSFRILKLVFLALFSFIMLTTFWKITIVEVNATTISRKFGDVNNNGMIDSGDTLLIQRHLSAINERSVRINHPEWCLSGYDLKAADVNQNGKTDIGDQLKVLRHISAQNDSSVKAEHPDWILSKSFSCSFPANWFYILISALNNNKAVDLNRGSTNNGANIQLWSTNNTYAQVFHLIRKGQYYTMTNIATGKAIDVKGGSNSQGTNIQQYQVLSSKDNNAQLWKLESAGNGYYYIRSKIGNYMDVKNGGTKDGTNILTWEYNGGNNQKFKLVNVAKREPMYTQANLNLRKSNSTTSDVLAVMPKSSLVYRYCTAGDWSLISYNGKKGYASSKYLGNKKPSATANNRKSKKYNLTETQLLKIARLCQQEQGTVKGAKAEASLMANQLETSKSRQKKFGTDANGLYKWIRNGGWFAKAAYWMDNGKVSKEVLSGVRDVLINGNRTLPLYVDEHDCLSDIKSISTGNAKNKSDYIRGKTKVRNRYGSTWTFWTFPDSKSDPFGYTDAAYKAVTGK